MDFTEKDQADRVDPMIFIFPRQTKCIFHVYGSSGTIERRDAFCLLPQNILNEKVIIFIIKFKIYFIQNIVINGNNKYSEICVIWVGDQIPKE